MSYRKDLSYREVPFSLETPEDDFFLYGKVGSLYTKCEANRNKVIKVRTLGILSSDYGCFYIKEMVTTRHSASPPEPRLSIQVSVAHMSGPIKCSSMPYPVQLFGRLQWCGRPVIFAEIMQSLSVSVATMLHETMSIVSTLHCNI